MPSMWCCSLSVLAALVSLLKRCLVQEDALKRSKHSLLYRHIKGQLHREEKYTKTPFWRLSQEVKLDLDKKLGIAVGWCSVYLLLSC